MFDGTKTLVKYTPKKNKFVLVMSSFHPTAVVDKETKKPDIVLFYNDTKGGTDCFDHMCHEYTTARKTLRWPLRFWFGMLDQEEINSMILHNFNSFKSKYDPARLFERAYTRTDRTTLASTTRYSNTSSGFACLNRGHPRRKGTCIRRKCSDGEKTGAMCSVSSSCGQKNKNCM